MGLLIVKEHICIVSLQKGAFFLAAKESDSSMRMFHARSVLTTRSWAGAERAVTRQVRSGACPGGNAICRRCKAARNGLNGPPDSG